MPAAILDQFGKPATYHSGHSYGGTPGAGYPAYYADKRTMPEHPDCFGDFATLLPRYPWRKAVSDCRWIGAAFSLVSGAIEQKADYVGASHFATYFNGRDTAWGDEAEAALEQLDKICTTRSPLFDWRALWWCGVANLDDSGPFFINLTQNSDGFPLLQPLEAHRIGSWDMGEAIVDGGRYDGARILNGIIYDRAGREIAYRVLGAEYGDYRDISARDMIHVAGRPRYFSQGRALPRIAPALKDLYTALDTREAEQIAQNVNSRISVIEANETGKRNPAQDLVNPPPLPTAQGIDTEYVDKGFYRYIKAGKGQITAHQSARPSDQWQRFDDKITATALFAMGWRVEMFDLSKLGGAAVRGFADQINTAIHAAFNALAPAMIRCRGYQIAKLIQRGDLRDSAEWWKWLAQEPAEFTADPSRAVSSEIEAVRAGAQTMPNVHRRWGTRSRNVINEQAAYLYAKKKAAQEWSKDGITITAEELGTTAQPGDQSSAGVSPASGENSAFSR